MGFFDGVLDSKQVTGNFVSDNDFKPIPDRTVTKSACTEAGYKTVDKLFENNKNRYIGERFINLRWDVVEGEYKGRVTFQKLYIFSTDPEEKKKAYEMLAAIDFNAGGKLIAANREPTDMDLMQNLANKIMFVRQRIWGNEGKKQGNRIDAVQGKNTVQTKTSAPVSQQQEPTLAQEDEDLAF